VKGYERISKDIGKAWEPKKRNASKESPKKKKKGNKRIYTKDIIG